MNHIVNISTDRLWPHPENPRKDLGDLTELAESVRKNGIMQNLTIVPLEMADPDAARQREGKNYTVLIGHRRLAAAKLAGITELPCRIEEGMDKREQVSTMLEENMLDLCQYFGHKKLKVHADFFNSSSSFCWGVI